jgi:hypothetical protein
MKSQSLNYIFLEKKMSRSGIVFIIAIILSSCITLSSTSENIRLSRFDFENDMFLPHEGIPAGVPNSYRWKYTPTVGYGANIPEGWNAVAAWGQVYADQDQPNPDKDFPLVRVHIKDLQLYIYQKDRTWKIIQNAENPVGALYTEDFVNNINIPARIRYEKEGGISIQAGSGFNFHFYPKERTVVDRNNIAGIFVVCKARLTGTENYKTLPKYLISIGGDYWRNLTALWKSDWSNNNDIGLGRFKYVTAQWQYFTMHTFSFV